MSGHVLLTGATGLIGRYLLRDLLLDGVSVAVVARPAKGLSCKSRIEQLLTSWEAELGVAMARPMCLDGDITHENLGLSAVAVRWVRDHCQQVVHNAASVAFHTTETGGEPRLSNVTGTRNVLTLCDHAGIRELHYTSTAYVCGRRTGTVYESELGCGQEFRNDYEASKLEAETLVRSDPRLNRVTVYRPAIVVGDSRTGYTCAYDHFYLFPRFTAIAQQRADAVSGARWHHPVRLNLTGDEHLNLVPVDWVAAVLSRIIQQPARHGGVYHLTPDRPVTVREAEAAIADYFNYHGVEFVGNRELQTNDSSAAEQDFYAVINSGAGQYWRSEPLFDGAGRRAATPDLPCPEWTPARLRRLIDFAVRDRFGRRRKTSAFGQKFEFGDRTDPGPPTAVAGGGVGHLGPASSIR